MQITNDESLGRFQTELDGATARLDYKRRGRTILFTHTEVPPAIEGRGVGSALAKAGLEFAREQKAQVAPLCPFVRHYIEEHPEYADMVTQTW